MKSMTDFQTQDMAFRVIERAVLYARVSGNDEKYATSGIEGQLDDCRRYAQQKGYQVVDEFF